VTVLLSAIWALAAAAMSARVFQTWWAQPVPVFNPATDGPMPDDIFDSELGAFFLALVMSVPLTALWLSAAASGFGYLRSTEFAGRQRTAWACTLVVAAVLGIAFIRVFLYPPAALFGPIAVGHANWILLAFSAAFLIVGVAMITVIETASRDLRPRHSVITRSKRSKVSLRLVARRRRG
jgi:hypothetical protein